MIKCIIIPLLFLLSLNSYGQRRHTRTVFDNWARINQFNKQDSLEGLYVNDSLLNIITDTLPLYTFDENSGWRDLKIVYYFYDSSNMLKKMAFRNGRAGYYYFYFNEASLRKVRLYNTGELKDTNYYFTAEENLQTISGIELRASQDASKKHFYESLKLGKEFVARFKTFF